jgi:hypothetical protein
VPRVDEPGTPRPGTPQPGDVADAAALEADVARLLAEHAPGIQAIERAVRTTIRTRFPDAVEQVDFGNKLIAFGRSMKIRGLLFAIIAHASHVNLQLADGATLHDQEGLIEGTAKRIRHVKVRSVEMASTASVVAIVEAQLAARPAG